MSVIAATGYPAATMLRACELFEAGWKPRQIPRRLEAEGFDPVPTYASIYDWTRPEAYERRKERSRRRLAAQMATEATFTLRGRSPEYRAGFIRLLAEKELKHESVAKCCQIVLGIPVTSYCVKEVLQGRMPRVLSTTQSLTLRQREEGDDGR